MQQPTRDNECAPRPEETETHINKATRHCAFLRAIPLLINRMVSVGVAKAQLHRDTEAVAWLRRGLEANRNFSSAHFYLAAALARLGELDQAGAAVQAVLALDPTFTIWRWRGLIITRNDNPTYLAGCEHTVEGMRLAEVPEG